MSGIMLPIPPPPFGTSSSNPNSPNVNRVDTMPNTETINASPTINVSRSVDDDLLLLQLLDSRGGSQITNVPTFDREDFTSWKIRFLVFLDGLEPYLITTLEDGPFVPMSNLSTPANPLPKRQNQWLNAESRPSDTRDTKIAALRLKFNAFKEFEGEKDRNSDVEEDNRTSNKFMVDLNAEYYERALLANQKRFYKRSGRRIDELTKGKDDKGKGDKRKSDKGLVAELFDWDDESVSSKDEETTKFKAFMAIADDEPSVGKSDARYGQWVDITMKKVHKLLSMTDNEERKHVLDYTHVDLQYVEDQRNNLVNKFNTLKQDLALHKSELCNLKNTVSINCSLQNEVIRVNLENESLKDEISDLKKQIPGNIVKALEGKGRRKENNSKEVLFTKADVSTSESAPMITSDSEDDSDNQIKKTSDKVSQTYVIKKKTEPKHPAVQISCPDKNALPSTEQLLLTLMEEVKGIKNQILIPLDTRSSVS
ncbi:hypothetical protein Tco_0900862 [Tanacetum coccineum]